MDGAVEILGTAAGPAAAGAGTGTGAGAAAGTGTVAAAAEATAAKAAAPATAAEAALPIAVIKFPYLIETSPTVNAKVEKSTFPVTIEIEGITISLTKEVTIF